MVYFDAARVYIYFQSVHHLENHFFCSTLVEDRSLTQRFNSLSLLVDLQSPFDATISFWKALQISHLRIFVQKLWNFTSYNTIPYMVIHTFSICKKASVQCSKLNSIQCSFLEADQHIVFWSLHQWLQLSLVLYANFCEWQRFLNSKAW